MTSAFSGFDLTTVLVLDDDADHGYQELLREKAPQLIVVSLSDERDATPSTPAIWFGAPDKAAMLIAQGLKPHWLQLTWAGFAPLTKPAMPSDYLLTRAVDVFGQPMLEYVLFHMLGHVKPGGAYSENQKRFIWCPVHSGGLQGRRVMLVGAGNIGLYVAKYLSALGMEVLGVQRTPTPSAYLKELYDLSSFRDALATADFVVNILPDTADTRNLFDRSAFECMKPSALFINIGRGTAVVDGDLVEAVESGQIAAAVLDVFRHEPLPPSHQFWVTPNITITPHIAGPVDPVRMVEAFLRNLDSLANNQSLDGLVDLTRGY